MKILWFLSACIAIAVANEADELEDLAPAEEDMEIENQLLNTPVSKTTSTGTAPSKEVAGTPVPRQKNLGLTPMHPREGSSQRKSKRQSSQGEGVRMNSFGSEGGWMKSWFMKRLSQAHGGMGYWYVSEGNMGATNPERNGSPGRESTVDEDKEKSNWKGVEKIIENYINKRENSKRKELTLTLRMTRKDDKAKLWQTEVVAGENHRPNKWNDLEKLIENRLKGNSKSIKMQLSLLVSRKKNGTEVKFEVRNGTSSHHEVKSKELISKLVSNITNSKDKMANKKKLGLKPVLNGTEEKVEIRNGTNSNHEMKSEVAADPGMNTKKDIANDNAKEKTRKELISKPVDKIEDAEDKIANKKKLGLKPVLISTEMTPKIRNGTNRKEESVADSDVKMGKGTNVDDGSRPSRDGNKVQKVTERFMEIRDKKKNVIMTLVFKKKANSSEYTAEIRKSKPSTSETDIGPGSSVSGDKVTNEVESKSGADPENENDAKSNGEVQNETVLGDATLKLAEASTFKPNE